MDIKIFNSILKDPSFFNYQKMLYKYGENFNDCLNNLEEQYYRKLSLSDFSKQPMVFIENTGLIRFSFKAIKILMKEKADSIGIKAAEEEMIATAAIENIDFSRESVRHILKGMAPKDDMEDRIAGLKKGLEYIADANHRITEENLHELYQLSIGNYLEKDARLHDGAFYRHDTVYVVSDQIDHCGLSWQKIPEAMQELIAFIEHKDDIEDLIKGAMIHYAFANIHPYFDGNGRMARLLHLWFLIQKGYHAALFVPFSSLIEQARKDYYRAFSQIEENRKISGNTDLTPFLKFFQVHVYDRLPDKNGLDVVEEKFSQAVVLGQVTKKEVDLWRFVISNYGTGLFSTKDLEKDYRNVAYATVRTFVMKFEKMGLLYKISFGSRPKYKVPEN